ncbi:prepilin peptidase [Candidatus Uhrbacteria bacterium]|nr:prepilin peptidase [Candidatus Uhrbacteria bacterium]
MITYFIAAIVGLIAAGVITGGVFRAHDEWRWMRPKRACLKCELPRGGADLLPVIGSVLTTLRCRSCKAHIAWQYPVIEAVIFLLVLFHFWRYINGMWVPDGSDIHMWLWLTRDILFTLFLVIVFVYDFKYSLILDRYTVPGIIVALGINLALGINWFTLVAGMFILLMFFLAQYALSGGRLLGAGDIRMGILMGAMLGFVDGISAMLIAYVVGAIYAMIAIALGRHKMSDHVPFGTFLSIGTFTMIVWGKQLLELFL